MQNRDRLIELIQSAVGGCARHWAEKIADYLIDHGVIVPMTEYTYTDDEEIINMLERCVCHTECTYCPLPNEECMELPVHELELIRRQRAEIERLNTYIHDHVWDFCSISGCEAASNDCWKTCPDSLYNKAKSEAVKEFAERLRSRIIDDFLEYKTDATISYIDNLLKEMLGDNNE